MDRIDEEILRILKKNPTESYLKIAKKINVSPSTVKARYEKMENKIFSTAFIIANLSKIGYNGKAMLMITYSNKGNHLLLLERLEKTPNVFVIAETIGKFDIIAFMAFRNISEIKKIVNDIRALISVKKVEIALTDQKDFPMEREYVQYL
jgi:DNA-binding Lrp family transcriptional regulator